MLLTKKAQASGFRELISALSRPHQRLFLLSTLNFVSKRYLPPHFNVESDSNRTSLVSACAALVLTFTSIESSNNAELLSSWIERCPNISTDMYRAVIIALPSKDQEALLERTWTQFGDKLFIRHAPMLQQESMLSTSPYILHLVLSLLLRISQMLTRIEKQLQDSFSYSQATFTALTPPLSTLSRTRPCIQAAFPIDLTHPPRVLGFWG